MSKEIEEGMLPFGEYETYYRIVNPKGKKTPLVLLHGGPGSTHNSYELLDHLAFEDDRPFIMYDQLGCGKSSFDVPSELFCKETWVKELINLRQRLNLNKIHLLGHSWGGMLEIIYLCDYKPGGIESCVFSSTLASASLWKEETHRLIRYLSPELVNIIVRCESENDFKNPEFIKATEEYTHRFVSGPWSDKDPEFIRKKKFGKVAYETAWGVNEYSPMGNLKDYEYLDRLHEIKCPILLLNGVDDESTPYQNLQMFNALTCEKKWHMFAHSRHMSYYQQHDEYCNEITSFLNQHD